MSSTFARSFSGAASFSHYGGTSSATAASALSPVILQELKDAFNLFDSDQNGSLDWREIKAAMRAVGVEMTADEVRDRARQIGIGIGTSSGAADEVTFDEFVKLVAPKMGDRDSREEIDKVFDLFDEDRTGYITFRSLKKVCADLGESLTEEDLQQMIDEADRDQDGKISREEFYRVMKKRGTNPYDEWDSDDE